MKCHASLIACIVGLLGHQTAEAGSPNYEKMLSKMPCAAQVNAQVTPRIARQTWVPALVSVPNEPLHDGITFRDTRNTEYAKYHRLWLHRTTATYVEGQRKWSSNTVQEIWRTWDSKKKCKVQTSERSRDLPPLPVTFGFTDENLFNLMVSANYWGVIYVTTLYPPAVNSLKELKAAVQAKGGHLTVVIHPDIRDATPAQLQPLVDTGAVNAVTDILPLASREIMAHSSIRQSGNYPITLIYRAGLLSNRDRVGPFIQADYERWIDLELNELKNDVAE
jgi:hypothetical protein